MTLVQYNQRYEEIIHADWPRDKKDKKLAELVTEMEQVYQIPMLRNEEWERENKRVIALYRKVSLSRSF
ncbi:hypothetical protein AWM68_20070 [Fictibacillus phosphorivorans]|uniref:Uncharacterized protein n=1 Tax=Fictibacillus phosphorivorans TaxID=1221500 RepID=A0A165NN81_9BACL|nr:hypothetical protein [Fictibacillus phosphorivorans]KZE66870.1 hypothetical protein AWM68_20070 [Fictibacillus phosphorivorans]